MARKTGGNIKDLLFERTTGAFAFLVLSLAVLLFAVLLRESLPALRKFGAAFLVTGTWDPVLERFGALPFVYGTIVSSFLAVLIAVPLSVGAAIFINEYAPAWMKTPVSFLAELLAAIPSVIYGLWGIFVLVPVLRDVFMKPVTKYLGWIPLFKGPVYGPSMLAAGVLLDHDHPVHPLGQPGGARHDPAAAEGGGPVAGRHPMGDAPDRDRAALHPRHLRSDDPRPGTGVGRDDGGHDGH